MKAIGSRLDRLEKQLGVGKRKPPGIRVVLSRAGWCMALDQDTCLQILGECGFLATDAELSMVNFCQVPDGLNAQETERFLRERGAELCSPRP
jgi:hypothetical protein